MWTALRELFAELWWDESGHTSLEYAILAGGVAMAILGAVQATAANVGTSYDALANKMP